MFGFILTIVFGVLAIILGLVSVLIDNKKASIKIIAVISAVIACLNFFASLNLSAPELYMTNGDNIVDNELYFKAEWPMSVYYTFSPYADPRKEGVRYEEPLDIRESVSVSYVSSFLGILWGNTESRDIVLKPGNHFEVTDTDTPGTSIAEIKGYLTADKHFPGDELTLEDFHVYGLTIAGEEVALEEYGFSPQIVKEGKNEVILSYRGLTGKINFIAQAPEVTYITAEYVGESVPVGTEISASNIQVTAFYEDGHNEPAEDFKMEPLMAEETGELEVTVSFDSCTDSIMVPISPKVYPIEVINELHTPNGFYDPEVYLSQWIMNEDLSVTGQTYKTGLKLEIQNLASSTIGNGTDFM